MESISDTSEEHQLIKRPFIKKNHLLDLLIFAVVAFVLLLLNWPLINISHIEAGDFAANSLLIQKAKHFDLFVGNYSRVGFNHPGPAILYVLTFGERVLFDWMHIVPSPLSGQMVAAILYNAAWITIIFRMLRTILGSTCGAGLMTTIFLCIAAYQNYQFFAGMWFPELYFFPFATALISVARFASGSTDMLLPLALSAGFLVNGHVSFVSTMGIIFALLLIYHQLVHGKLNRDQYLFGRKYWKANAWPVARAVFVLLLFLIPLAVETIRHPPGPVASYISFGRQHDANTLGESIKYSSQYWGGRVVFISATVVMAMLLVRSLLRKHQAIPVDILSLLATLIAATIAMLVYSKFGVDMLDQKYIGYFYYAVPALTASLIAVWIMHAASPWFFAALTALTIPVLLFATVREIDKVPDYANFYTQPSIIDLYNKLEKIKPAGRLVLNLDSSRNWGDVWSTILGLEIYAKRRGNDLFCIKQNWHISFTKDVRCTPDEIATQLQYEVSSLPAGNHLQSEIEGAGLAFRKYPDEFSKFGFLSVEKSPEFFGMVLGEGWSAAESQFVWMQANEAHLLLKVRKGYSGVLQLDLGAFLPHTDSTQHLSVYVNNALAYRTTFDTKTPRQMIRIPIGQANQERLDVRLVDPDVMSPKAAGVSDDPRTLGVSLYGFGLVH